MQGIRQFERGHNQPKPLKLDFLLPFVLAIRVGATVVVDDIGLPRGRRPALTAQVVDAQAVALWAELRFLDFDPRVGRDGTMAASAAGTAVEVHLDIDAFRRIAQVAGIAIVGIFVAHPAHLRSI